MAINMNKAEHKRHAAIWLKAEKFWESQLDEMGQIAERRGSHCKRMKEWNLEQIKEEPETVSQKDV